MSYDVAVFFCESRFPGEQWEQVMAAFDPQEHQLIRSKYNQNVLAEWTIRYKTASLWLDLRDVRSDLYFKPHQAQWQAFITRSGHKPIEAWLQLALPYQALVLMDDVFVYDFQRDVTIDNESQYLEFAALQLGQFGLGKMFKLGLLDSQGKPLF